MEKLTPSTFARFIFASLVDRFKNEIYLKKTVLLCLIFYLCSLPIAMSQADRHIDCRNDDNGWIEKSLSNVITLKTGHFIPNVIPHDYTENVIFRAILDGAEPTEIFLLINGVEYPLENKGTNNGSGPAGTIYELEIDPSLILNALVESDVFRVFVGFLEVYDGSQRVLRVNEFAQIWTPDIPVVPIQETDAGIRYTNHVVNIIMDINKDNNGGSAYQTAATMFYGEFDDRFDFLSLVLLPGYNANRFHQGVKNEVSNIGLSLFNSTSAWGSMGRLSGVNVFPLPTYYDGATTAYSHEIGHQWINFLNNTPYQTGIPHWPFCNHANGVMGFSLPGGAGGTFSNVLVQRNDGYAFIPDTTSRPGKFFQDMDLYLMGLIPADDIEDKLIFNPNTTPVVNQVYPASDFTSYTKDDLINDLGERIPDYLASQKEFNMATLLISPEPLSDIEIYFYDFFTKRAMSEESLAVHEGFLKETANPFYVSTRGLGSLDVRLFTRPDIQISPRVYLQGAYDPISGLMSDNLRENNLIPLVEPYTTLGYAHIGGGGELVQQTTFDLGGADAIVDWLFLELRDKSNFNLIKATRSALLQRDGDVVDVDGVSPVAFADLPADDYYLVVKHRNHLGVMSAAPIAFSSTPTVVDFTSDLNQTFGGVNGIAELRDGLWGLHSGDFDHSGQIQNTDFNAMTITIGNSGYVAGDMDLNGQVQNTDLQLKLIPNIGKGQVFGQ